MQNEDAELLTGSDGHENGHSGRLSISKLLIWPVCECEFPMKLIKLLLQSPSLVHMSSFQHSGIEFVI